MAKDVTSGVLKFDAADQYEGVGNAAEATAPIYNQTPIFVQSIFIEAGASGGSYDVRDTNGGRSLTGIISLAGTAHSGEIIIGDYVSGVYVESFGSDGQILVKTGGSI